MTIFEIKHEALGYLTAFEYDQGKCTVEIVRHHERGENFTLLFLFKENIIQNQSYIEVLPWL